MKTILALGQSNNDTNREDAGYVAQQGVSYAGYDVRIWNPHSGAWQTLAEAAAVNDPTWPGSTPRPFFTGSAAVALACRMSQELGEQVNVICPNWPGSPIANWLPATAAQYASDKAMCEAALAALGVSFVDLVTFLQGEGDASRPAEDYRADHDAWRAQIKAESWCGENTPMVLFGLVWGAQSGAQNNTLSDIASENAYTGYAVSLDLSSDNLLQHYDPAGLWALGYDRGWAAYQQSLGGAANPASKRMFDAGMRISGTKLLQPGEIQTVSWKGWGNAPAPFPHMHYYVSATDMGQGHAVVINRTLADVTIRNVGDAPCQAHLVAFEAWAI